jgi:pimeloyl-ACP methyl ester carboxylesterase
MAVLGIELPLHGTRATSNTLADAHTFNLLQPKATRSNFRQGALDALYITRALAEAQTTFQTAAGESISIDPDRIVYMGHSQGALVGALALPWMGESIQAAMLSAGGGQLSITAVERTDDINFPALIRSWFRFDEDEALTELHPILGIIQSLVDVTDPINYAPYWLHEPMPWVGQRPVPILVSSGILDGLTPYRSSVALAAAARIPVLFPRESAIPAVWLRGLTDTVGPLQRNTTTWGKPVTAALAQWPQGGHFVVFDNPEATWMVRDFFSTATSDTAVIQRGGLSEAK